MSVQRALLIFILLASCMYWMSYHLSSRRLPLRSDSTSRSLILHHHQEQSDVYHSPEIFRMKYEEMEKKLKIFVYPDGISKTFYQWPRKLTGEYASEGYFFRNIRESQFITEDPEEANLFFIPISYHKMRGKGRSNANMTIIVQNYMESLISKYPYWNRTLGADHFFVSCHDVRVQAEGLPLLVKNSIRAVCTPSYDVGFIPHKDICLPQVLQPFSLPAGGNDIKGRTTLGFWAGHRNSKIGVKLAHVWENDTELDISNNRINRATKGHLENQKKLYQTKYCICSGGSQVDVFQVAESVHYGCIPVILSHYFDLPYNDILKWRKFAMVVREKDIHQVKQILKDIPHSEFVSLHKNLVKVQSHFKWNTPPKKYDAFHMVLYELWLRRGVT